jgi:hypothetical protein
MLISVIEIKTEFKMMPRMNTADSNVDLNLDFRYSYKDQAQPFYCSMFDGV